MRIGGDATVLHQSFCGRMCSSIVGVVIGFLLFLGAIALTAWNEGDYVTQQEVVTQAYAAVQEYPCDSSGAIPKDGTTLVFLQGCQLDSLPTWSGATDFQYEASGAWLSTTVEMYQWIETKHSEEHKDSSGGKTTVTWYTHSRAWSADVKASPTHCDQPDASASCRVPACRGRYTYPDSASDRPANGACNPVSLPRSPAAGKQYAPAGSVGLGDVAKLNSAQLRSLTSSSAVVPRNVRDEPPAAPVRLPVAVLNTSNTWLEGGLALTEPQSGPRVGDVRLRWAVASATAATALAAVGADGTMAPWASTVTARVAGSPTSVDELMEGDVALEEFFDELHGRLLAKVWGLRIVSLLLFFVGPLMVLQPIALAPEIVPCVGQMLGEIVGCAVCCASLVVGLAWFLLVTGACWVWYRPLVGLPLMLFAVLLLVGFVRHRKRHGGGRARAPRGLLDESFSSQSASPDLLPPASVQAPHYPASVQAQALPVVQPQYFEPEAVPMGLPVAQPVEAQHTAQIM